MKTVIRKRGEEIKRLGVSRETYINSLVSSLIGKKTEVLRPQTREETLYSEETFKRPLTQTQFSRSLDFFSALIRKHERFVLMDFPHNNMRIDRKEYCLCVNCGKSQTFKTFRLSPNNQCPDCKVFGTLRLQVYYVAYFFINPYERIMVNYRTNRVCFQHEINRGVRNMAWKTDFSGLVRRDF